MKTIDKLFAGFSISILVFIMAYLFAVIIIGEWNILNVIPLPTIIAGYLFFSLYLSWAIEPVISIKRDEW